MAAQDDLPTQEFLDDYAALVQMPEAENPDLYKRFRQLLDSARERRPDTYAIGAEVLTSEDWLNEERRFGRELLALIEKERKDATEFERMSKSGKAEVRAKAKAQAEEDLAFGKAYAARLSALVDEYRKMKAGKT